MKSAEQLEDSDHEEAADEGLGEKKSGIGRRE